MPLFKFCPLCGGKLDPVFDGTILQQYNCKSCGQPLYRNPAPTATAVLTNTKGEILLTKRVIEPFYGYWDLPGGYIKNNELPVAALHRELMEELNIQAEIGPLLDIFPDTYGDENLHTFNLFYHARFTGGDIRPGDDVGDYRWTALDDLPDKIAFTCIHRAIRTYSELINQNN